MVPSDLPGTPSLDLEKHHTKGTPVTTEEHQGSTGYSATLSLPEQDKVDTPSCDIKHKPVSSMEDFTGKGTCTEDSNMNLITL